MNPHRTRDLILTVVGCAAVLIYILACASFSPDDSKIVFPSWDPGTWSQSVAVYDRNARTTEHLLALPLDDLLWVRPGWTPDGRRVIALWGDNSVNDRLQVALLPFRFKEPTRVLSVAEYDEIAASMMVPPQILGSYMFLTAKSSVLRLDLENGAIKKQEIGDEAQVVVQQGSVYYGRTLPAAEGSKEDYWQVGRLDANTLECTPIFQVPDTEDHGMLAVSRDGSRIAVMGKKDELFHVLVFGGKDLVATIPFGAPAEKLEPGNLQWSPDASTLYAVYVKPMADGARNQFGVLELPVNGGPSRQIPLFVVEGDTEDITAFVFQIDLSHDGQTLAGASTYVWLGEESELKAEDLALYLIDLTRPDRRVTKIPIPVPPKPKAGMEKK